MSVELTSATSTVEITESGYEITIVEQPGNLVYLSEQAPTEVVIQEQPSNIVTVTYLPHTVELTEEKYFVTITEGILFDPSTINLTDLGDVVGTPVYGSTLEFDGTNWAVTMADFEIISEPRAGDDNILYVGKGLPGAIVNESSWQIQRVTIVDDWVHIDWADGNSLYDNNWSDRENITYTNTSLFEHVGFPNVNTTSVKYSDGIYGKAIAYNAKSGAPADHIISLELFEDYGGILTPHTYHFHEVDYSVAGTAIILHHLTGVIADHAFEAQTGTIEFIELDETIGTPFSAILRDIYMIEVTINQATFVTTAVPNGEVFYIPYLEISGTMAAG